jgi:hypothetical protein
MANIKEAIGASTAITITVASLGAASARESLVVDNSALLYLDAMITFKLKTVAGLAADKAIYIWLYASEDGTLYDYNATGADAAITLLSPHNFKGPFVINTPTDSLTYIAVLASVASFFGGVMPKKWGVIVENQTGQALTAVAGDHSVKYSGIYHTVN